MPLSKAVYRLLSETCVVILFECAEFIVGSAIHQAKICFALRNLITGPGAYAQYLSANYAFSSHEIKAEFPLSLCHIPNASANQELSVGAASNAHYNSKSGKNSYVYHIQKNDAVEFATGTERRKHRGIFIYE